ncbi:MAG TPA: glutathione S-transferase [Methylophilaceae bacterium]|nr:glutathione S-transferase [Methylophilaceae bacterium]
MPLPILYTYRRCPYAMRARMALHYSGIEVEMREIALRSKPDQMLAASPKGTVPVLVLLDGTVIDESLDIMRWALAQHDPHDWLRDAAQSLVLIDGNDDGFKHALDRYKYAVRFPEHAPEFYRAEGERFLTMLEARLQQHAYLLDEALRLADIAIFPFVRQFAGVDADWWQTLPYPRLRGWLAERVASPLFESIMHKHAVWSPA